MNTTPKFVTIVCSVVVITTALWAVARAVADQPGVLTERDAFKAIESSILVAAVPIEHGGKPHLDAAAMIIALGYVDRESARKVLIRLSEVYLGEADAEALHSALTMQGKKVRSDVAIAQAMPVRCQALKGASASITATIENLHCLSQEEYSTFLKMVLDDIDAGRVVPYAL